MDVRAKKLIVVAALELICRDWISPEKVGVSQIY